MEVNTEEIKKELNELILKNNNINNINDNNKYFYLNIFINKPVFKTKENIKVHIFGYNKSTKKPILKDFKKKVSIKITDSANKERYSELINYNSENENHFVINNDFNQGFYKISIDNKMDSLNFLIQDNPEKNMTISINWNKEFINGGDNIIGKISANIKSLKNIKNRIYSYSIYNDNGLSLFSKEPENFEDDSEIEFIAPSSSSYKNIIIKIDFDFDGLKQTYSKIFNYHKDTYYNIKYFFESVNPILNKNNWVYLKIISNNNYEDDNDKIPINTKYEVLENNIIICQSETILDGRGKFLIKNFDMNKNYWIRAQSTKKKIRFKNNNYLKLNKRIFYYGEFLNFDYNIINIEKDLYFGIHDNSKFIYSNWISNNKNIKLGEDFEKGGIYELVIFTKSTNNIKFVIKNLFFIKPKNTLKIDFKYENNKNLINFDVKINNNLKKDDIYLYARVYEDNLLNYIEENKRESNLLTKVFLTNESEYITLNFNYSKFYNFLDNDCDKNLDLYLGTIFRRLEKKSLNFFYKSFNEYTIHLVTRLRGGGGFPIEPVPKKEYIDSSCLAEIKSDSQTDKKINIIENEKRICYQKEFMKINNNSFKDSFKLINPNILYRIEITAVSKNGIYSYNTFNIFIKNDIDVVISYPNFIYWNNNFEIIVSIRNNLKYPINVSLYKDKKFTLIESNSNKEIRYIMNINNYKLVENKISEEVIINYSYNGINKIYKEKIFPYLIVREIKVTKNYLFSINKTNNKYKINEFDLNNNFGNVNISLKNNKIDFILGVVKNLIKDPYGCFEQMASVTFPMAIAYDLLLKLSKNQLNDNLKNKIYEIK